MYSPKLISEVVGDGEIEKSVLDSLFVCLEHVGGDLSRLVTIQTFEFFNGLFSNSFFRSV